ARPQHRRVRTLLRPHRRTGGGARPHRGQTRRNPRRMKPRERVVVDTNALIGRLLHPFRGIDILTPAGYLARWREPAVGGKAAYRQGEPASVRVVHGTPGFRA